MHRREFLRLAATSSLVAGCGYLRIDPDNVLIRSDIITSLEEERRILAKANLGWTDDQRIRVLFVQGTPYERGYQQGALLRDEIDVNLTTLYNNAKAKFHLEELFYEAYERARPFITEEYIEEMHGLAHGSKLPINLIHAIHILPEITEWGGKKKIKATVKQMMDGSFGTSCSNFAMSSGAVDGDNFYAVRILDWGLHRISKLHRHPLITVGIPDKGNAYVNIGWMGFIGAISGMNDKGITLGEMGYGDPPNETLRGKPMPFLLRDILTYAGNLADVRGMIESSPGTGSFVFLMTDGKTREAEMYIKDRERFLVFKGGADVADGKANYPAIQDIVYGGHYQDKMTSLLTTYHGKITPEIIMSTLIPGMAMPSNFQDVVYDPGNLSFWVSNSGGPELRAAEQPYSFFNFGKALGEFRSQK